MDVLTGVALVQFGYDAASRLMTITDANGNVTSIERDGNGKPLGIVGPFGQRSTLVLDADGLLSRVTNPAGESVALTYHEGGLLATLTDPKSAVTHFSYDSNGENIPTEQRAFEMQRILRSDLNANFPNGKPCDHSC
jgi:YD repeat-containing protein